MSRIVIELSNQEENDFKETCCREGETIIAAITRIVLCEIKSKKLQTDLRDGGHR